MRTLFSIGELVRQARRSLPLSMPRKRKDLEPGQGLHLSVRLEPELSARLDECVGTLARSTGLTVSRTDVVRLLMKEALDARDARLKQKK